MEKNSPDEKTQNKIHTMLKKKKKKKSRKEGFIIKRRETKIKQLAVCIVTQVVIVNQALHRAQSYTN